MNRVWSTEIAELIGAEFSEGEDDVVQVAYGTFSDLDSVIEQQLARESAPGKRLVLIPVIFPEVSDTLDGAEPAEGLRFARYAVPVHAMQRWAENSPVKPWRVKQALVNDLLLPKLDAVAAAINEKSETQPPGGGYRYVTADVSGGGYDVFPEIVRKGWLSAAATLTVIIAQGR